MEKKNYMTPELEEVNLNLEGTLLAGSIGEEGGEIEKGEEGDQGNLDW